MLFRSVALGVLDRVVVCTACGCLGIGVEIRLVVEMADHALADVLLRTVVLVMMGDGGREQLLGLLVALQHLRPLVVAERDRVTRGGLLWLQRHGCGLEVARKC